MAKYLAGGRVRGTLHGVTYQRNLYTGWVAKEKSSLSAEQIATSPAFQRTRENNNEMKGVGVAVKALRGSLSQFLPYITDPIVTGRMIREVKKAQIKSAGIRGQRKIAYQALCNAMQGFEVSNVYRTDAVLKALSVKLTDKAPAETFDISASCSNIVWPMGANCGIPFVTTIEITDVAYDPIIGDWFFQTSWERRITQSMLLEWSILNFIPTETIVMSYNNDTNEIQAGADQSVLSFTENIHKNSDEFGRILVWFGIQFGQLVEKAVTAGQPKTMEFYPMRGATAGLVVGDLAPNPAG